MKIRSLFILFICIFAGQALFADITASGMAEEIQAEIEELAAGRVQGVSDELLDRVYSEWEVLEAEMMSVPVEEGLQFMLPVYTNLNRFLQNEPGLTDDVPSMRIVKLTSVVANLFTGVLKSSRELLSSFDPDSIEFKNRAAGLSQAQIGGANMVLGASITLFTVELPELTFEELKKNLWGYGPSIYSEIDLKYRDQLMSFYDGTVEPAVLPGQKELYKEFIALLKGEESQ